MHKLAIGVVEDRNDPLFLGRCRVRVSGIHNENKTILPTADLPWASPLQPITSAAMSGIGQAPVGPVEGTWVAITFFDEEMQQPVMLGTFAGVPGDKSFIADIAWYDAPEAQPILPPPTVQVRTQTGTVVTTTDGTPVTQGYVETGEKYLGTLTRTQYDVWKAAIGKKESTDNYGVVNQFGYLGKYQMGIGALEDMGYIVPGTTKLAKGNSKAMSDPAVWTGKNGVNSREDFLAATATQENVMDVYTKINYTRMFNAGVVSNDMPPEKLAGMLAAAHNQGAGAAIQYAKNGVVGKDGNGVTIKSYYEYGYASIAGKGTSEDPTVANMNNEAVDKSLTPQPDAKKYDVSGSTQVAAQSTGTPQFGFADPNGVYPKKDHLNEPDTNRLARSQQLSKTIVGEKEADRTTNVPIANSGEVWSQPPVPYNAKYPFNHVIGSESGHIVEMDDTDGYERINVHHKSGTFIEVDKSGNQVNRVKASRVSIIEKEELVYIKGSGHVAVDGDITLHVGKGVQIYVASDANIQVAGNAYMGVKGNIDMKADGHINMQAGGDMNIQVAGRLAADAALIHWNSGLSEPAADAPGYSPEVPTFSTPTRQEAEAIRLEDTEEAQQKGEQEAEVAVPEQKKDEDTTPPEQPTPVSTACDFILPLNNSTQLTTNYNIGSLCKDGAFPFAQGQHGLSAQELACNLKQLTINVIEPLRTTYGDKGFTINSCFRPAKSAISKSKTTSQHELGQAVDIGFKPNGGKLSKQEYFDIAKQIKDTIPFDQLLLEYRAAAYWIHISFKLQGNRSQVLTMKDDKVFGQGLILLA